MRLTQLTIGAVLILAAHAVAPHVEAAETSRDSQTGRIASRLERATSIQEIDGLLHQLATGWFGQQSIESLLKGWGDHGSWYDLAVMRYVWHFWPATDRDEWKGIDPAPLITTIQRRAKQRPDLVRQLFWYARWEHPGMTFRDICDLCRFRDRLWLDEEFPAILYVAGAMDEPRLLQQGVEQPLSRPVSDVVPEVWDLLTRGRHELGQANIDTSRICDWWDMTGRLWFLSMRPFLRFDVRRDAFVFDQAAERENRYLKPEEQMPTHPTTPLPNWDRKTVPARPSGNQ